MARRAAAVAEPASAGLGPHVVDQLDRALGRAVGLVDRLPTGTLLRPTPCQGWTVRDVVNHLAAVTEKFGRFAAGAESPIRQLHGDLLGPDPPGSLRRFAGTALAAWRHHPEALVAECGLPFGCFDGATAAGINLLDAVVHAHDIAAGAGVDLAPDDALAELALAVVPLVVTAAGRSAGAFAAPESAEAGASATERLLAATGRRPSGTGATRS